MAPIFPYISCIIRPPLKPPFLPFCLSADACYCWFRNDEDLKPISYSMVFVALCLCLRMDLLFLRYLQWEQIRSFSFTLTLNKVRPPLKTPWSFINSDI
ncbi:hypothetical protein V6N12_059044 [Hibiscus sabdariffa]|uniref:Uncharacterized protein n=1 Tax=Hibiscus sabdariffa TaxID=183260 RepID=A0ABR2ETY6_9ROSI